MSTTAQQLPSNPVGPLPPLIRAMLRPEFYPLRPQKVELVQTHISFVLLADEFVYKVKKAVRFPFLDFSTLAHRRMFCNEEVRLNRRLARNVYLGVVSIYRSQAGFAFGDEAANGSAGEVCEYAVWMRRLADERMLDQMIRTGTAGTAEIHAIAKRLAEFHREASPQLGWKYGAANAVAAMIERNLQECERLEGVTTSAPQLDALGERSRAFIAEHWHALNRRACEGRVREGHGDLRCEHIFVAPGGEIEIVDCVEFSEALRYSDVACDIAFLAMDLDRLGARALSRELVESYARFTGEGAEFLELVRFYEAYRATVRAKVESLRSLDRQVPQAQRDRAKRMARDYFAMACRYLGHSAREAIVVVCGPAGTGKSTLARAIGRRLHLDVVNSDEVRKRLAGFAPTTKLAADYGAGIYSGDFTRRTYEALAEQAGRRLASDTGVVLDATFRHPHERHAITELASRSNVPVLFVECRVSEEEVIRRLGERAQRSGEVSDADARVYLRQRADFIPLEEIPRQNRMVADTARNPDEIAGEIVEAIGRLVSAGE